MRPPARLKPWFTAEQLGAWLQEVPAGDIVSAKQLLPEICAVAGREVSLAYVDKLLHRQQWRKLAPRPRHVKQDRPRRRPSSKPPGGARAHSGTVAGRHPTLFSPSR